MTARSLSRSMPLPATHARTSGGGSEAGAGASSKVCEHRVGINWDLGRSAGGRARGGGVGGGRAEG
eukprot:3846917-Prymnesium_polylepis.1